MARIHRLGVQAIERGLLALGIVASAATAQSVEIDNRDGPFVNLEEAPIHPLELRANGTELWVANVAGSSVSVFDALDSLTLSTEIPVGLGPVTIRRRPGTSSPEEMWVVCQSSGTIVVIDATTKLVLDAFMVGPLVAPAQVQIGGEPCGLVFDAAGAKAYCTLSAIDQVVEIDATTRTVVYRKEFGDTFQTWLPGPPFTHAQEPRALVLDGTSLYVLSFESGNGTVTDGDTLLNGTIVDLWPLYSAGQMGGPPPDRDLFQFTVQPLNGAGTTLWRMGNLNFDVKVKPYTSGGPVFYVSNVDHKSTQIGEHAVLAGGVARHRVSFASAVVSTIPQATTHIDLNDSAARASSVPVGVVDFGVPNEMVFNSGGTLLYVCCYETRNTAVIEVSTSTVVAELKSSGFGPRGLALDEASGRLYVYNRADATVDVFDVTSPNGTLNPAAPLVEAGYDPTPKTVKAGRRHHINADNSNNDLQSCNTCHMDGHWDRIAWDLGQFTGALPAHPVPKDAKGTKVTQSLRGIDETPPLHWRGDRNDLGNFNPAFAGLLGGSPLSPEQLEEYEAFVFSLSFPPNPLQKPKRKLSVAGNQGHNVFRRDQVPVDMDADSTSNSPGPQQLACYVCHSQRGVTGTSNQVVNNAVTDVFVGVKTFADNPAHLRGLFDKEADVIDYPPAFPIGSNGITRFSATGWGFGNNGSSPSLVDFIARQFLAVNTTTDRENLAQFLREFDSGLAPATAWSWTLDPASAGSADTSPVVNYLLSEADLGNCEVAVRGRMSIGGPMQPIGFLYTAGAQTFISDSALVPPKTYNELDVLASAGATFVFLGVPVGMGRRIGIDRDMDFLVNQDEASHSTSPTIPDFDNDGFPDGYEIANGSVPTNPSSTPASGPTPTISKEVMVYQNTVVAKFRWTTDVESTSEVRIFNTSGALVTESVDPRFDRAHALLVRGLPPGGQYTATLESTNPNGVSGSVDIRFVTRGLDFMSTHVDDVGLVPVNPLPTSVQLHATVRVLRESGAPRAGATVKVRFVEWTAGNAAIVTGPLSNTTDANGNTTIIHPSANGAGSGAFVEVIVDDVICPTSPFEHYFHPLDREFSASVQL